MRYLKKYNEILSSDEIKSKGYGIFDFFNDMKGEIKLTDELLKKWTDHFIGDGWYDKIDTYLTTSFNVMKKVDIDYINDRLYEVWDVIPKNKYTLVTPSIIYGDYYKINEPTKTKYSGLMPLKITKRRKKDIMCSIILNIIYPTLQFNNGYKDPVYLRKTPDEIFVTDEKYQCQNFDIKNFIIIKQKLEDIHSYSIEELNKYYSVENVLHMYVPCILIQIGSFSNSISTGTMNLKKLESDLDETLPPILSSLDHSEVIWSMSRGDRKFNDDMDIYDYSLKILLNF